MSLYETTEKKPEGCGILSYILPVFGTPHHSALIKEDIFQCG